MSTNEQRPIIDKSQWGEGPWQTEPDRIEWKYAGLPCLMVRNPHHGAWCGYAAVPPGHAHHGADYEDVKVSVHGGLTYASKCAGHICHIPDPGEPDDVWWLGFDCAHFDDLTPGTPSDRGGEYRDMEYVKAEVESLAEQLAQTPKETR